MTCCLQTTSTRTAWLYIFSSQEPSENPPFNLESVLSLANKWMSIFMCAPLIPVVGISSQQPHEMRRVSRAEYSAMIGAKARNKRLQAQKKENGIEAIESGFTAKTTNIQRYNLYVQYLLVHETSLRQFYSQYHAHIRFPNLQGRNRAREELANIVINGGKKYNRKKRKKRAANQKKRTNYRKKRKKYREQRRRSTGRYVTWRPQVIHVNSTICRIRIPSQPESAVRSTLINMYLKEPRTKCH